MTQEWGGWFEVPSGVPSPPPSPRSEDVDRRPGLTRPRSSGDATAAHHITEECERLFCETLRAVFLVEKDTDSETSLVMDALDMKESRMGGHTYDSSKRSGQDVPGALHRMAGRTTEMRYVLPTPSASPDAREYHDTIGMVKAHMEMYDYAGGARFRGFVAEKGGQRALFVFFDKEVIGQDLKPGLTALLELASAAGVDCDQLVVCVDRTADGEARSDLIKDLGWVGFELTMVDAWSRTDAHTSERWLFLSMDV